MTTFAEVQMKNELKKAKTQADKEAWASRIIVVRAVEYLDGLRMIPIQEKEIKKIAAFVLPCNVPAINDILKEVEADEVQHKKAMESADIVG